MAVSHPVVFHVVVICRSLWSSEVCDDVMFASLAFTSASVSISPYPYSQHHILRALCTTPMNLLWGAPLFLLSYSSTFTFTPWKLPSFICICPNHLNLTSLTLSACLFVFVSLQLFYLFVVILPFSVHHLAVLHLFDVFLPPWFPFYCTFSQVLPLRATRGGTHPDRLSSGRLNPYPSWCILGLYVKPTWQPPAPEHSLRSACLF